VFFTFNSFLDEKHGFCQGKGEDEVGVRRKMREENKAMLLL